MTRNLSACMLLSVCLASESLWAEQQSILAERFDAPTLTTCLWNDVSLNGATASQSNGTLEFRSEAGRADSRGGIQSKFFLVGNFDVQVDFDLVEFYQYWSSAGLGAVSIDGRNALGIYVSISTDNNKHFESGYYLNGIVQLPPNYYTPPIGNSSLNNLITGKLRLSRLGNVITSYFGTGASWTTLVSAAVFDGPASVLIHSGNGSTIGYHSSPLTRWDNLNASASSIVALVPIADVQGCTGDPAAVTFSLNLTSFTYTGSAQGPTVVASDPAATFTVGGTLSAINAGSYTATATATGNYSGTNNALIWTIKKADQIITFANPGPQVSGTPLTLSATASSGLPVSYTVTAGPATVSGSTVTFSGTGSVTITASQPGDANWNPALAVVQGFSVSGVLEDFNRADGELGTNWTGLSDGLHYLIASATGQAWYGGPVYWNSGVAFGPSQEAFVTLTDVSHAQGLDNAVMLKVQSDPVPANGSYDPDWIKGCIVASYNAADHSVYVATWRPYAQAFTIYASQPLTMTNGDVFGARSLANGDIQLFRNGAQVATVTLDSNDRAFFNDRGGHIGLWFDHAATAKFDDFGGGTLDAAP